MGWVKNGPDQKWAGSKMGRVKNGRVKNGQVKNELGQKWYIIVYFILFEAPEYFILFKLSG